MNSASDLIVRIQAMRDLLYALREEEIDPRQMEIWHRYCTRLSLAVRCGEIFDWPPPALRRRIAGSKLHLVRRRMWELAQRRLRGMLGGQHAETP